MKNSFLIALVIIALSGLTYGYMQKRRADKLEALAQANEKIITVLRLGIEHQRIVSEKTMIDSAIRGLQTPNPNDVKKKK